MDENQEQNETQEKSFVDRQVNNKVNKTKSKIKRKILLALLPFIAIVILVIFGVVVIIQSFTTITDVFTDIFSFSKEVLDENGNPITIDLNTVHILRDNNATKEEEKYSFEIDQEAFEEIYNKMNKKLKEKEKGITLETFGLNKDLLKKIMEANLVTSLPKIGEKDLQGSINLNRYDARDNEEEEQELIYVSPEEFIDIFNQALSVSEEIKTLKVNTYAGNSTQKEAITNFVNSIGQSQNEELIESSTNDDLEEYKNKVLEYVAVMDNIIDTQYSLTGQRIDLSNDISDTHKVGYRLKSNIDNLVESNFTEAEKSISEYRSRLLREMHDTIEKVEEELEAQLKGYTKYYTLGNLTLDEDGSVGIECTEETGENGHTIIKTDLSKVLMIKYDTTAQISGHARAGSITVVTPKTTIHTEFSDSFYGQMINCEINIEAISYQDMVRQYNMPYEFLVSLLMVSSSPNWIEEVADLVIEDSRIDLTIHDNYSRSEDRSIKTWTQHISKDSANATITGTIHHISTLDTITTNHNLSPDIEFVRTWLFNKSVIYNKEEKGNENSWTEELEDTGTSENGKSGRENYNYSSNNDVNYKQVIEQNETQDGTSEETKNEKGEWIDVNPFLRLWKNSNGLAELTKAIDSQGREYYINDKFERKGKKVVYKILGGGKACTDQSVIDGAQLLFMLLGNNQNTQNYEQVLRYLLYRYTGNEDYGVTDVSEILDIFQEGRFSSVSGGAWSVFWNNDCTRDEFINFVNSYNPPNVIGNGGRNAQEYYKRYFVANAGNFYDICTRNGIDPRFIFAIGIHESYFGTSNIANTKGNFWGWGAIDSNPMGGAHAFNDMSAGIESVSSGLKIWATSGSWQYNSIKNSGYDPTTIDGIGSLYASDSAWAEKVKQHMSNIFGYTGTNFVDGEATEMQKKIVQIKFPIAFKLAITHKL